MRDWEAPYNPAWVVRTERRPQSKAEQRRQHMEYMTVRSKELARANREEKIFTSEQGPGRNKWRYESRSENMIPSDYSESKVGWREKSDGTRERVQYFLGFGWLSSDELAHERQHFPRT